MEDASAKALNLNVHFIPKSSTDSALTFLRSSLGEQLKNQTTFRVVTDMNRENEEPTYNAGARLIKALRELGYRNECMVFTSDKKNGDQIIKSELNARERESVIVTTKVKDLQNFVNFDEKQSGISQLDTTNPSTHNKSKNPTYHGKLTLKSRGDFFNSEKKLIKISLVSSDSRLTVIFFSLYDPSCDL
jgi:hypothetical protein